MGLNLEQYFLQTKFPLEVDIMHAFETFIVTISI